MPYYPTTLISFIVMLLIDITFNITTCCECWFVGLTASIINSSGQGCQFLTAFTNKTGKKKARCQASAM